MENVAITFDYIVLIVIFSIMLTGAQYPLCPGCLKRKVEFNSDLDKVDLR